jgi:hypothetical protein
LAKNLVEENINSQEAKIPQSSEYGGWGIFVTIPRDIEGFGRIHSEAVENVFHQG